jgi:hypothetical protein
MLNPDLSAGELEAYRLGYHTGYAHQVFVYGLGEQISAPPPPRELLKCDGRIWDLYDQGFDAGIDDYHEHINS